MIKGIARRASVFTFAFLSTMCIGFTVNGISVSAEEIVSDHAVAGMTRILEEYYESVVGDKGEAEKYLETFIAQSGAPTVASMTEIVSPYENLGISIADNYVNIRKKANTESDVVGKLYRGCATDILKTVEKEDGEWVKIKSGNVEGYIKKEYLAIGVDAEALVEEFADKYATIKTETLFVRAGQSTDSKIVTMVPGGETFYIVKEHESWAEIMIDEGDDPENSETGFVSKDYIDIEVRFQYAISIEEERAKLEAEEAARRAEAERLEALAREQEAARKKEAERKAAAEKAAKDAATKKSSSNSGSSSKSTTEKVSTSGSGTGKQIADYAVKFVGNPYRWAGTSLTNGADCSGFVQSIFSHFGYGITRTSADQANSAGTTVSMSERQAGDLIFYRNSSGRVNHVALYIGNDKVVHASNQRDGIKISSYNYRTPYKVRRIVK